MTPSKDDLRLEVLITKVLPHTLSFEDLITDMMSLQ